MGKVRVTAELTSLYSDDRERDGLDANTHERPLQVWLGQPLVLLPSNLRTNWTTGQPHHDQKRH